VPAAPHWLLRLFPAQDVEAHRLIEVGEEIRFDVGHHWVAYLRPLGLVLVAAVVLLVIFPLSSVQSGWLWLLVGPALLATAWVLAAREHRDRFVLTSKRVMRIRGLLDQQRATMPLSRILDITVHKPALGRLCGYGHLTFESAAQVQGLREIRYVPYPDSVDHAIQVEVHGPHAGHSRNTRR